MVLISLLGLRCFGEVLFPALHVRLEELVIFERSAELSESILILFREAVIVAASWICGNALVADVEDDSPAEDVKEHVHESEKSRVPEVVPSLLL